MGGSICSPIKKAPPPPKPAPTMSSPLAGGKRPSDVRLTPNSELGVPLTRSKSDRARLLSLAQDVMADMPLQRSAASDLALSLGDVGGGAPVSSVGLPLTRSAASELAISLDAGMSF